ncbi:MAG TPA: serine--tRNA ligase [Candidatus Saccharimonadales bacterium]|nr:serine--tRNA ligase [Candidatus Saccharimonadales bacterium]
MIDITILRNNPDKIEAAAKAKRVTVDVHHILEIDAKYRELALSLQKLREERNKHTESIKGHKPTEEEIAKGKEIKEKVEKEEHVLGAVYTELQEWLLKVPNPAKPDVPVGKDDSENVVIKKHKEPTTFNFTPKDHIELGEALGIIDVKAATKVSGPRFGYLKNEGALLEFALKQLAFEILVKEGFTPIIPPVLIRKQIMDDLGYTAMGEDENIFFLEKDDLYLVGTSEQSVVPIHKDEVLKKEDLPKRYVSFSTCFRREAGSYGKDTKGIFRVHQFDKVEMISFVEEGKDDEEHAYLLSLEERFFQMLDIPYQVLMICTGDLGFNAARKYDIEAWIPSQNKYREVTSTSTVTDFQSRGGLNMRYQDGKEKKYLSVLNGTAFSMNRPIIAILENYQQEDGSIVVPEVLRKYIGKDKITPKK